MFSIATQEHLDSAHVVFFGDYGAVTYLAQQRGDSLQTSTAKHTLSPRPSRVPTTSNNSSTCSSRWSSCISKTRNSTTGCSRP